MAQEQEWQTLSGTVENIVYCNEENGYTVLEFSSGGDLYTAVGELSDVNVGEDVTLLCHTPQLRRTIPRGGV